MKHATPLAQRRTPQCRADNTRGLLTRGAERRGGIRSAGPEAVMTCGALQSQPTPIISGVCTEGKGWRRLGG